MATGSLDSNLSIWSIVDNYKEVAKVEGIRGEVLSIAFSGDSKYLAAACTLDTTVKLWS